MQLIPFIDLHDPIDVISLTAVILVLGTYVGVCVWAWISESSEYSGVKEEETHDEKD